MILTTSSTVYYTVYNYYYYYDVSRSPRPACLKWLFLSGMFLVAKAKNTSYLLGSVTQILQQASFSVDGNKHRTLHAWQKRDSVFSRIVNVWNLMQIQGVTTTWLLSYLLILPVILPYV